MMSVLELPGKNFKITMIKTLKKIEKKRDRNMK